MSIFLKIIGVIILGSGVVMGFVSGEKAGELATLLNVDGGFRFGVALIWWLSGIISGSLFFALGLILETAQENNLILKKIINSSMPMTSEGSPTIGQQKYMEYVSTFEPKPKADFSKIIKKPVLIYGLISVILLAGICFFVFMDFSGPTKVAAKFMTKVQEGEYNSAEKYILKDQRGEYGGLYLRGLREEHLQGEIEAPESKLNLTGDTAVQIVKYKEDNKEDISIPIYLKNTFWGWKIIDIN